MYRYKNKIICLFILFIIICSNFSIASDSVYVWSSDNNALETSSVSADISDTKNNFLNLESGSAILIEQSTGQILYEHNIHDQLRPASVTKIMSILLIMEALDSGKITLDTKIPCSENASSMGGSQIWLNETEQLTLDEMLKAICVVSANDCVMAVSEYLGGSEAGFVEMMNAKAKELGMNDTCFKNCHGIDEDGHVTSAYDIALMSRELLEKHPQIKKYTTIYMDSLRDGKSELVNTNKLVRNYSGCTGLKTGSTSLALYNLSASATRDDLSLIAVIMKAPTTKVRFSEAQKLLDYGFANYACKSFGKKGDVVSTVFVNKGVQNNVNAIFEESPSFVIKKGEEKNITQSITMNENISAPISKGQVLGKVAFSMNDKILQEVNIVSEENIARINFWNISSYLYSSWFNVLRSN